MAQRICGFSGCDRPHSAKGWCNLHYQRFLRYGDPALGGQAGPEWCLVADCGRAPVARGLCDRHWRRWRRHGDIAIVKLVKGNEPQRFEAYTILGPVPQYAPELGPCWLWTRQLTSNGYGKFNAGDQQLAHRWSYEFHIAPIPAGLELDHLCRIRRCVNPWHLEPVTTLVNRRRALEAAT